MKLAPSTIYNDKDQLTFEEEHLALNVNIECIDSVKVVDKGKSLLHIVKEDIVVGFIILSKTEDDDLCHFDGCIFEVTIAIYKDYRGNNYALEALMLLNDWVKKNIGKVRLEAVIRKENPYPRSIKNTLKNAGYVTGIDICEVCEEYCAYRGLLQE